MHHIDERNDPKLKQVVFLWQADKKARKKVTSTLTGKSRKLMSRLSIDLQAVKKCIKQTLKNIG